MAGDVLIRGETQLPSEIAAIALGFLAALVAAVPLWFAGKLAIKRESRVGFYTMYAILIAQSVSMLLMICLILACYFIARPMLLWFAISACILLLAINVVCAFLIIRPRGRMK